VGLVGQKTKLFYFPIEKALYTKLWKSAPLTPLCPTKTPTDRYLGVFFNFKDKKINLVKTILRNDLKDFLYLK
jgi:hypothetical protein